MLLLLSMPAFTAALAALLIDRNFGGHYFDPAAGGSAIMWQHIFWFFGHPEVYILILPAMGMVSEILPVFSRKPLFGYRAFVYATLAIAMLGVRRVGAPHVHDRRGVRAVLRVPDGGDRHPHRREVLQLDRHDVAREDQLSTADAVRHRVPDEFLIGGINGVFPRSCRSTTTSTTPTGWCRTCTTCCSAGSVFGIFAGFYYWLPKMTGRFLNEGLGKVHFWFMFVGINLAFFPMHIARPARDAAPRSPTTRPSTEG